MESKRQAVIDYLKNERIAALECGDHHSAYNLTCWLNFVNRQAGKAEIARMNYLVKVDQANRQPVAVQQSLF